MTTNGNLRDLSSAPDSGYAMADGVTPNENLLDCRQSLFNHHPILSRVFPKKLPIFALCPLGLKL